MTRPPLVEAVASRNIEAAGRLLADGADPNAVDPGNGLAAIMIASGQGDAAMVKLLLRHGASVFITDRAAGATALHKACQGGSLEVVALLTEAGAFINAVVPSTGHTPLIEALWFKWPDIVEYLLARGAGLNLNTHYGFTLLEHFQYALNVNVIGKDKLLRADSLIKARQESDRNKVASQRLMAAVMNKDLEAVGRLIAEGADLEERYPVLNGFNDEHTPLLVACRDGHCDIARALLQAGANVNVTEPTFGAVPLHKATYNGHADITALLAEQPGVDLDFQGPSNGYAPLHDALWHGYAACAEILINAGARLDLKGHDGKTPLDIATEVFGAEHRTVALLRSTRG